MLHCLLRLNIVDDNIFATLDSKGVDDYTTKIAEKIFNLKLKQALEDVF